MSAEEESIQMALRTGEAVISSASQLVQLILQALHSAQGSRPMAAGEKKKSIVSTGAAAVAGAVDRNLVRGHGKVGQVSERELRSQAEESGSKLSEFPIMDSTFNDRDDIKALSRELAGAGLTFSIKQALTVEGAPCQIIILKTDDIERAEWAVREIAYRKLDADPVAKEPDAIAKGPSGDYPDEFDCQGLHFERDVEADGKTWVARAEDRHEIRVTDLGGDRSSWEVSRLGKPVRSGSCEPSMESDWLRDERGNVISDADGAPIRCAFGGKIDQENVGDAVGFNVVGKPLEGAVAQAAYHLDCARRPAEELAQAEKDAKNMLRVVEGGKAKAAPKAGDAFQAKAEQATVAAKRSVPGPDAGESIHQGSHR